MPSEGNGKDSLQEVLKQLLYATPKDSTAPPSEKDDDVVPAPPASTGQEPLPPREAEAPEAPRPGEPAYEVEIIPPGASPEAKVVEAAPAGKVENAGAGQSKGSQRTSTMLDGVIEIQVRPTVSLARVAEFEHALRQLPNVQWLGTFGKSKQGTTVKIQLLNPSSAESLFVGDAAVEKADVVKAGGAWRATVTLPAVVPQPTGAEELPLPEDLTPPAAAPVFQRPSEPAIPTGQPDRPATEQEQPQLLASQREIDIEASPVTSLDDLNRLEKLLTSLAPGCRIVNVLSLDGVATVLITLEGIDRSVLTARLPEKVSGVMLDTTHKRVVVKLPERW